MAGIENRRMVKSRPTMSDYQNTQLEKTEVAPAQRDARGRFGIGNQLHGSRRGVCNLITRRLAERISQGEHNDPLCVLHDIMMHPRRANATAIDVNRVTI